MHEWNIGEDRKTTVKQEEKMYVEYERFTCEKVYQALWCTIFISLVYSQIAIFLFFFFYQY